MKYTVHIDIEKPIDKVVALFDNEENLYKWMDGLQSIEHISGQPGEVGAKSRLKFLMGKREMEMTETVEVRNLPNELTFVYEAKGVHNRVVNRFEALNETSTRCYNDQEFNFKGFMKVFGALFPGAFKKQSMTYLKSFKNFAEKEE